MSDNPLVIRFTDEAVANLAALEPGWTGHGGERITAEALAALAGCKLQAIPCSDGGIAFSLMGPGFDVEVELDERGRFESVVTEVTPAVVLEGEAK